MSIATKTGDLGTTALMFNRRVSKCHPRVEACGCVDELNAAVGLARASEGFHYLREHLRAIQDDLVPLMGELATAEEDWPRYQKAGYRCLTPEATARLDQLVYELEGQQVTFSGWATPGQCLAAATLDVARTVCRRAERRICGLAESGGLKNTEVLAYINRLSDVLWLLARWAERQTQPAAALPGPK